MPANLGKKAYGARIGLVLETDLAHDPIRICPGPSLPDFTADVRSQEEGLERFIPAWVEAGVSQASSSAQIVERQAALDAIRSDIKRLFQTEREIIKAHTLLETGYAITGEMAHRWQLVQRLQAEDQTGRLNRIVQSMATTFDVETLMELLAVELPGLGIQSCFVYPFTTRRGITRPGHA